MRPSLRRWRFCLMLVFVFASAGASLAVTRRPNGPVPFPVEAGHPYASAFAAYNRLSPAEREDVVATKAGAAYSPAVEQARREIAAALARGRDAAPRWRAEHDPLSPGFDPEFMQALSVLAGAGLAAAERAGGAAAEDSATLDALALYLSAGPGLSTDDWARQQGLVGELLTRLQAKAARRSPAEAAVLLAELRALPPPTSFADMALADPLWKTPGAKLRRALERKARAMGFESDRIDPAELRMTGFAVEATHAAVSFETPEGAFWLEPGQGRYGVSLRELDVEGRQARILFDGREAVVELTSRRIGLWEDEVLERVVKRLSDESDFMVALFLEGRKEAGSLSEHLARLDEFGREADALARDVAEGTVGKADSEARAERAAMLQTLAPWPNFKGADFVQGLLDARDHGEKTQAEWRRTGEILERAAGGPAGSG